jgi:hypothetical protein
MILVLIPSAAWGWVWMDDGGQYACSDSLHSGDTDAPMRSWESIEDTGDIHEVSGRSFIVPIGFNFGFYGEVFDEVVVDVDMILVFERIMGPASSPRGIPDSWWPNAFIAPVWVRVMPSFDQRVYTESSGATCSRGRVMVR